MTDPIAFEIGELGTLVKQLAETVAAQQTTLAELARAGRRRSRAAPAGRTRCVAESRSPRCAGRTACRCRRRRAAANLALRGPAPAGAVDAHRRRGRCAPIRGAIEANRIDLYLQPIVTLPQRKVRYYEAMSRLRTEAGELLHGRRLHRRRRKAAA